MSDNDWSDNSNIDSDSDSCILKMVNVTENIENDNFINKDDQIKLTDNNLDSDDNVLDDDKQSVDQSKSSDDNLESKDNVIDDKELKDQNKSSDDNLESKDNVIDDKELKDQIKSSDDNLKSKDNVIDDKELKDQIKSSDDNLKSKDNVIDDKELKDQIKSSDNLITMDNMSDSNEKNFSGNISTIEEELSDELNSTSELNLIDQDESKENTNDELENKVYENFEDKLIDNNFNNNKKDTDIKEEFKTTSNEETTSRMNSQFHNKEKPNLASFKEFFSGQQSRTTSENLNNDDKLKDEINDIIHQFNKFNIDEDIMNGMKSLNLNNLTKVQENVLMRLKNFKENGILIKINMFSNKELAYLIYSIGLIRNPRNDKPHILILLPTTEIAENVYNLARALCEFTEIKVTSIVKGIVSSNVTGHIVICTLGILAKCLFNKRNLNTRDLKLFILDEFDILVNCKDNDKTIQQIIYQIKNYSKLLFFSSTIHNKTKDFVDKLSLSKISTLDLLKKNEIFKNILHFFMHVNRESKFDKRMSLSKILDHLDNDKKVIIYVSNKFYSNVVYETIQNSNLNNQLKKNTIQLNSDLKFDERFNAENMFKESNNAIIIATYPLTIGINLGEINVLINYNFPKDTDDTIREYLHRIQHCGRFNRPNFVINFANDYFINSKKPKLESHYHIKMLELKL